MNRKLVGKRWAKRPNQRMISFFFLENPNSNIHWHGLIKFSAENKIPIFEQQHIFDWHADLTWRQLVPKGTVNIQQVEDQRSLVRYVTKMLPYSVSYESFVLPGEFYAAR